MHGAGAPSAPSEEGAGAPKGFGGATEGERTRGCCLHQGVGVHKMIQVSLLLSARLYLLLSHTLGVSLPPSRRFNPLYAVPPCPLAVLRSCFGYSLSHLRTAAACLSRCIRHRRRSKAKPLSGRRGGYRRKATDSPPCAAPLSTLTTARCPLPTDFHYF